MPSRPPRNSPSGSSHTPRPGKRPTQRQGRSRNGASRTSPRSEGSNQQRATTGDRQRAARSTSGSTARSTTRPTMRRTASPGGGSGSKRFRRRGGPRFTGRAVILGIVLVLLALTLAYPARQYFAQQAQIAHIEQAQQQQRTRIKNLQSQKDKWSDPDYIRAQARKRRQYVEPGEMAYIIKDPEADAAASRKPATAQESTRGETSTHGTWYRQLWSTISAADRPATAK